MEKVPSASTGKETDERDPLVIHAEAAIREFYQRAAQYLRTSSPEPIKKLFGNTILKASEKFTTTASRITLIAGAISAIGGAAGGLVVSKYNSFEEKNKAPRHSISEVITQKGEHVFTHEDKETTHIINWLCGYESLTEEERASLRFASRSYKKNPELYQKLWKLQEEVGAPIIRWEAEDRTADEYDKLISTQSRARYDSETNTVYLSMPGGGPSPFEGLIAEDSHAEQFVNERFAAFVDSWNSFSTMVNASRQEESNKKENSVQEQVLLHDKTYDSSNTIEYNAHKEIEPKLWKELEGVEPIPNTEEFIEGQTE